MAIPAMVGEVSSSGWRVVADRIVRSSLEAAFLMDILGKLSIDSRRATHL